ncbi:MAG: hypothetical protein WC763_03245 [Candidatus Paceibacterota bacterium]
MNNSRPCRQIDLSQFGLVLVLTTSDKAVERMWASDDIRVADSDMRREVLRHIIPLIERGEREGKACLKGICFWERVSKTRNGLRAGETLNVPVSWRAMLPWWHPDNALWWKNPFCGRIVD